MIEEGDTAPAFTLPTESGEVSSTEFIGRKLVVYFYPKDDTSGCTKEAIAFSELLPEFEAVGATILGISKDSVKKHAKFREKHELTVPLAADEDGKVCDAYGVWKEKSMYGKTYMGIERSTFLIDADGKIAKIWRKVKVPGHAESVLEAVKAS